MYADGSLVKWLLFDDPDREPNADIAEKNGIKSETSVRKLRSGESVIENMKFKNAAAMTSYAEKKLYGESDTEKKIQWLLEQYEDSGNKISKHELIKKMTDSYYELAKGHFINELNRK